MWQDDDLEVLTWTIMFFNNTNNYNNKCNKNTYNKKKTDF